MFCRHRQSGNVLFLILIAVALFAALSYAVTQSTRSGGGDASSEKSTINSSVMIEQASSVRSAVTRMMVSGGVAVTDLEFNAPADFATCKSPQVCVFHPQGGGVTYGNAPAELMIQSGTMAENPDGLWVYSLNFEIKDVGSNVAGSLDGNDLVAFLAGVKKDVCAQVNAKLGISGIPSVSTGTFADAMITNVDGYNVDDNYVMPTTEEVIGTGALAPVAGKSEGCIFQNDDKVYVYYSVISER